VNGYIIDKNSKLIYDEDTSTEDIRILLTSLTERGFMFEGSIDGIASLVSDQAEFGSYENEPMGNTDSDEVTNTEYIGDYDRLCINMPVLGFTDSSLENLEKLVAAKAWILKKMAGTDALPIERDGKYLRFQWFRREASAAEIDAYSRLVARLCETAKQKQRVTATEHRLEEGDNEKFKARCMLLALGFIGKEYAQARKILLAPMSGSGAHRSGNHKQRDLHKNDSAMTGTETGRVQNYE
jgi:hypothetical protein